jgi:hypothetical protein
VYTWASTHPHSLSLSFLSLSCLSFSLAAGSHTHTGGLGGCEARGCHGAARQQGFAARLSNPGVPTQLGRGDFPTPKCQTPVHDQLQPSPGHDHGIGSEIGTAFQCRTALTTLESPDISWDFAPLDGDMWYGRPIDCRAEQTSSRTELRVWYMYTRCMGGHGTRYPQQGRAQVPPLPLPITLNLHQRGAPGLVSRRLFCLLPLLLLFCASPPPSCFSPLSTPHQHLRLTRLASLSSSSQRRQSLHCAAQRDSHLHNTTTRSTPEPPLPTP